MSIWFVIFNGDLKYLQEFSGIVISFLVIIKNQIFYSDLIMLKSKVLNITYIILISIAITSIISRISYKIDAKKPKYNFKQYLLFAFQYTIWTLAYLLVYFIYVFKFILINF